MLTTRQLQDEIIRLKKEKGICIIAHAYMNHEILEVADYTGDSYGLSVQASKSDAKTVIMCGVRFMAETCKILSPEKTVILSSPVAGCPMAEQLNVNSLKELKAKYPGYTTVAYINTTSELKTECDVCVTSSSAVQIVNNIDNDKILFIPDCNLGSWVKKACPDKDIALFDGGCPVHKRITKEHVISAKAAHPDALVLVHPECSEEVTLMADYAGSTTGIMAYAKKSDNKQFIIGTENSIVSHLQYECPDKEFYPLSKDCICHNMKATTLADIYGCIMGTAGEVIELDENIAKGAKRCLDKMIELGG